jgi:multiple antibiotic resistance protein
MDQDFLRFGLAAFVTLLVVVDPPGVVPIYVALTKDEQPARRRAILIRAVLIAFGVALFFLVAGGVSDADVEDHPKHLAEYIPE